MPTNLPNRHHDDFLWKLLSRPPTKIEGAALGRLSKAHLSNLADMLYIVSLLVFWIAFIWGVVSAATQNLPHLKGGAFICLGAIAILLAAARLSHLAKQRPAPPPRSRA